MSWVDYAVLAVAAISIGWGAWRGLVREVMSLAGWVIAFLAANLFAGPLAETFTATMRAELRVAAAFIAIFIGSLVVTTLAGLLISKLAGAAGLGGLDRSLGGLFGLARAALIILALALLAGLTTLPLRADWKESVCGPVLGNAALALKPWLPPAFADRLRYH
jgi:membrane protein required for colicin V production